MLVGWTGAPSQSDGVDATRAWTDSTGEGVVVAVADTGVDPLTPALRGQLLPGRDFVSGKATTRDPHGHGTHVATLIAGNPQQSDCIFGVAPGARILPLRIATARGQVRGVAAVSALAYAVRNPQVRVINMSWKLDYGFALRSALGTATASGRVLLVSAAGNDARDLRTASSCRKPSTATAS